MKKYKELKYQKLSEYKNKKLTKKNGLWRDKEYSHILPKETDYKLNIIDTFRSEFWNYFDKHKFTLHQNFHHLNSSQALSFNLFFPLFAHNFDYLTYIFSDLIKISQSQNKVNECEFEKIIDKTERTNFDFFAKLSNGHKVLFEIKYTEEQFGRAKKDDSHLKKYFSTYEKKLKGIIKLEYINADFVLKNYQIIRNLSYLDSTTTVIFLFPSENKQLSKTKDLINMIVEKDKIPNVKIIYLENFIEQILKAEYLKSLHPFFKEFKKKYIE